MATIDYRVCVTSIDSYRYFMSSEMDTEAHIRRLLRLEPPTEAMRVGIAFHQSLEDCFIRGEPMPQCANAHTVLMRPDAMEVPVNKLYNIRGRTVRLGGRIDAVRGLTIIDYKTTSRTIDLEKYADAFQWQAYLDLYPAAQHFRYDVFLLRRGAVVEHAHLMLHRFAKLHDVVTAWLDEYCQHLDDLVDSGWIGNREGRLFPGPTFLATLDERELQFVRRRFKRVLSADGNSLQDSAAG